MPPEEAVEVYSQETAISSSRCLIVKMHKFRELGHLRSSEVLWRKSLSDRMPADADLLLCASTEVARHAPSSAKHRDAAADEATIDATSSDLNVCCTQALLSHPLHSRRLWPGANGQVHRNKHPHFSDHHMKSRGMVRSHSRRQTSFGPSQARKPPWRRKVVRVHDSRICVWMRTCHASRDNVWVRLSSATALIGSSSST